MRGFFGISLVLQALTLLTLIALVVVLLGIQSALEDSADMLDEIQADTGMMTRD